MNFSPRDGTMRLVFVEAKPDLANYGFVAFGWLDIRAFIAKAQSRGQIPPEAKIHYTGRPMFYGTQIARAMENEKDMAGPRPTTWRRLVCSFGSRIGGFVP